MKTTTKTAPATDSKPLRTKHVAQKFGLKPVSLRRVLRSMNEYADGVHTNYRWAENDPMLPKIAAAIETHRKRSEKAKAEAQARLKASKAQQEVQAKADAKVKA